MRRSLSEFVGVSMVFSVKVQMAIAVIETLNALHVDFVLTAVAVTVNSELGHYSCPDISFGIGQYSFCYALPSERLKVEWHTSTPILSQLFMLKFHN